MDLLAFKTLPFLLSFIGSCGGVDILPPGPIDANLGKTVTIKTLVTNPTYLVILWNYSDGSEQVNIVTGSKESVTVSEPYKGRVTLNMTNGYLTIGPLTAADSGDYSINIVSTGTQTGEIKLRVLEPVSDVAIKSNLPEAIEHNSTVVLTCSAKGSFLSFTWLKGTVPVVADKRITVKNEELSSTLTITDVLRTDLVSPIFCTAANKLEEEKSAPFNLTVYYGPDEVTLSPPNVPKFINSKANFNLSCSARSSPPAKLTWYRDLKPMEAEGPILTLEIIKKHNFGNTTGEYTCRANNEKTKRNVASAGAVFAVIEPILSAEVSGPTATLIAGNSTANLSCQATGGTVETVTWLKDGKTLSAGGRPVFSADKTSLMIKSLEKEDNGEYTCQLANPVNSVKASYKMVVNYGPEPAMVTGEKAVEVKDEVKLVCTAASVPPANFTWKFNGTVTSVKTAQYLIETALYKNTGTYTCDAHNAVTGKTTTYTHTLSVKEEGALDDGLSDGAIAGIVIAVLVALGAAIGLIMYCRQKVPVESPY
ncbi:carcinoembryonic antigen-related cell adhesion molecule 5 [Cebidichthys violaceus]|uniref:carcinoembryonic antigen-related cell adhesion molecule 5 n=1 Tax=Cebidichthys violaceus TaxID=271503 RepID=UPI0035C9B7EF